MKTVKLNAFDNPFVYGVNNKEYLVFNIDNETQTLKFQSLIGDLKVKTANILFKANSLPAKLYEMVVDDDILTFTLPSVLTGYNSSMYVYLLLNYSDDLSTSDLYTFKLVDKGSSTFNFEISSICESNISTIVSEEIKNERVAKSILDTVSNYEFDKLQHAQQSLSLVENAFSSTLEKRIDLFNSAYDKANATKSNTTGDINASDIDIPGSNTHSDLKDYVENVKKQMAERLKDVTAVSEQIQDEMTQEKQSFLGASLIFQQDLKQERDIISAYGESTRQHMDQEFNEVKDHADKVFADFSKEIPDLDASIKQVNDKIVATDNKVGTLNTKVTTVETEIAELEKMHDEVTQTINKGKPISLYSNSLDFPQSDYDYSGNSNLIPPISFASLGRVNDKTDTNIPGVTDGGSYFEVNTEVSLASSVSSVFVPFQPRLQPNKTYTLTVSLEYDQAFIDSGASHSITYGSTINGVIERPVTIIGAKTTTAKQTISKTFTTSAIYGNGQAKSFYQLWFATTSKGKIKVYYDFKLEEGSKATPYQPNLLDAPYYIGKHEVNKNIANPDVVFPINTNAYKIYDANILEDFSISKTYTLTIKGTKLGSQQFTAYIGGSQLLAQLLPVEGLTDVWSATFKPQSVPSAVSKLLQIYQVPSTTVGAVRIDWVKLEVSKYRTPPIKAYKYKGVSLRNTIDPKAFDWQEQTVADVSTLKEQVNTLTPKVDKSQLFKLTNDDGNAIKVDYMSPKPTSFLALAKNTGFYSISTAEAKLMSDYNELPSVLQNTFLFINNYAPRDGFIIQEITGGEISTQLVHKYYRRIEPDGTYKNWNKVITDKDVSKMKKMYSNSIDFGNYDYSGNPNLFVNTLKSSDFNKGSHGSLTDDNGILHFTSDGTGDLDMFTSANMPAVVSGKTYTISAKLRFDEGTTGDINKLRLTYRQNNGTVLLEANSTAMTVADLGKEITIKGTANVNYQITTLSRFFISVSFSQKGKINGGFKLYDIKIEEGSTATPYQPNLLDAPYYLSKVALGENIADPTVKFPITTSSEAIYAKNASEDFILGETYTVTIGVTKPASQNIVVYLAQKQGGTFKPVEGLTDTWVATVTITKLGENTKWVYLSQTPNTSLGPVQINWLKIEKGDKRTPNIKEYKYKGFSVKPSNSPNDYEWSIDRQYGEKRLDKMVNTTDPQSIDGTKNFLQVPTVKGNNVLFDEKPLPYEGWYTNGEVLTNLSDKAKLRVGPVVATIGKQYNRSMKDDPLQWNGSRYEATVLRDCTILIEGLARMQYGSGTSGQYGYLVYYRDSAQTQEIGYVGGTGGSVPNAGGNGDKLQWKLGTPFSRIMELHKGDVFNITFSTSSGAKADFAEVQTLHVMEIEPL